ncbi:hypothetical protein [Streptomyces sp. NPDC057966]|uniref:hypothetical protein n=1 Tax=Streptomyces sp. NPDC057966 TaxID=3346292 RepID=UPI0036E970B9
MITTAAAAVLLLGVAAPAQARAETYKYPGTSISWQANGEILTVKDTRRDGRFIYPMGQFKGSNEYLTPHCSTRGRTSRRCDYSVAEGRKIIFWVYSVKDSDMRKIGEFTVTA